MFGSLFAPITQTMEAISSYIIWGLFILGAIQVSQIIAMAVRAYYSLKIIKQVTVLLREVIQEVGTMKKALKGSD
jgi:hypothetical protein